MNPDADLGENGRHEEVSDEQATTYVSPEFKQQAAGLVWCGPISVSVAQASNVASDKSEC
jgi:hypothetical protein